MDTITYSKQLASSIEELIEDSNKTKQQISNEAGIAWATFSRRLSHPESSFFTIPEVISVSNALDKDFIEVLKRAEFSDDSALAKGGVR
jgi:hypothetical protein